MLRVNEQISDDAKQASAATTPMTADAVKRELLRQRLRSTELAKSAHPVRPWLWYGYLGAGRVTMLTSQWKTGKTTMISLLLSRMRQGGELAGLSVAAGRAAVVSEESTADWDERCKRLQIGDHVSFFCRPFAAKPNMIEWQGLLDALLELRQAEGLDVVVIDCLSTFLPGHNENIAGAMMDSMLPLRALTDAGVSILLVHHPSKGTAIAGQAARGSGALPSFVDVLIEKSYFGKPEDHGDRRRRLRAFSRSEDTRRHLVVELTAAGADYVVHEAPMDEASAECWSVVSVVLEAANERLTQQRILEEWPEYYQKPNITTVGRALRPAVIQGKVKQSGTGRRNDPYVFWLPGKEVDFYPGNNASKEEIARFHENWLSKLDGLSPNDNTGADKGAPAASGEPEKAATPTENGTARVEAPSAPASAPAPPPQAPTPPTPAVKPKGICTIPPPNLVEYTDPELRRRARRYPYG